MPFCQLYGMVAVNMGLHAGATVVTFPYFRLEWLLTAMEKHRVTTAYLVPPVIRTLAKHATVGQFDLSALREDHVADRAASGVGGRACAERLQCSVSQAYGLTEAVALTHFTPRHSGKIASLGVPVPDTECRIVDVVSREDVQVGELGEVWVRGPQVMKGYHNNPEITGDIIDGDGWLRTCDIGYVDSDGLPVRRRPLEEAGPAARPASPGRRTAPCRHRGHRGAAQGRPTSCGCSRCC